jgi:alpha-N-arabinofuranosidase
VLAAKALAEDRSPVAAVLDARHRLSGSPHDSFWIAKGRASGRAAYYCPHGAEDAFYPVPRAAYLKLAAVANEGGALSLFALNRDVEQEMTVLVKARGFGRLAVAEATVLTDSDLKAANSKAAPDRVKPAKLSGLAVGSETVRIELPPASWSVILLTAVP